MSSLLVPSVSNSLIQNSELIKSSCSFPRKNSNAPSYHISRLNSKFKCYNLSIRSSQFFLTMKNSNVIIQNDSNSQKHSLDEISTYSSSENVNVNVNENVNVNVNENVNVNDINVLKKEEEITSEQNKNTSIQSDSESNQIKSEASVEVSAVTFTESSTVNSTDVSTEDSAVTSTETSTESKPDPADVAARGRLIAAKIQEKLNQKRANKSGKFVLNKNQNNIDSESQSQIQSSSSSYVDAYDESAEYYKPKVGDTVLGLVRVSTSYYAELDIGAARLARLTDRESKPMDAFDSGFYDVIESNEIQTVSEPNLTKGKITYVIENENEKDECKSIVNESNTNENNNYTKNNNYYNKNSNINSKLCEIGSVLTVEIIGETINGQPLISLKRFAHKIAWWRAKQLMEMKQPVKVKLVTANAGGFLVYFEGIRAFLPIGYVEDRNNQKPVLNELVGDILDVMIVECNKNKNRLILSETAIKEKQYASLIRVGNVIEGRVEKILDYYAIVQINNCFYRGILHVSNISFVRTEKIDDVFTLDETYKFLIVDVNETRISLNTKYFEVEDGLIQTDLNRVMNDAESMAEKFCIENDIILENEEDEEEIVFWDETEPSLLFSPSNLEFFSFPQTPLLVQSE